MIKRATKKIQPAVLAVVLASLLVVPGCAMLQQFAALRNVDFALDGVSSVLLAGVQMDRVQNFEQLRPGDIARLMLAFQQGRLPLEFTLHVGGENPPDNQVSARLIEFDWTLFLQDRETISGVFTDEVLMPPGVRVDIPIRMQLDLRQFFDHSAGDMVNLVLNMLGMGGEPMQLRLAAQPSIQTPIGPIRYPRPITIVDRRLGS